MLLTLRHFNLLIGAVVLTLGLALGLVLLGGDSAARPLHAAFAYLPEGANGLPQLSLTFDAATLPQRDGIEAAIHTNPPLNGDYSWNGPTLLFTPATRPASDTTYEVRLRGGLRLQDGGRTAYDELVWQFHTRPARIAFLRREANGPTINLWLLEANGQTRRLTNYAATSGKQVIDLSVSPGGERIVYSVREAEGGVSNLWLVNTAGEPAPHQLVSGSGLMMTAPQWSPGGDLIAYERRLALQGGFSATHLWLVRPDGVSLPPLYGSNEQAGIDLEWAAGGNLSFFWEPLRESVGILNFGPSPTWLAMPGLKPASLAPSPDGSEVILARYDYSHAQERELLWRWSRQTQAGSAIWQPSPIQPPAAPGYNDSSPAWSPDNRQVAFIRQKIGAIAGTSESSLWVFDAQSGQTRPILETPQWACSAFQWAEDGQSLLVERYPVGVLNQSEIWRVSQDGSNLQKVIAGFAARWVR